MQPGGGGAFCDQAHNGRLELNLRRVRPELRNPNRTADSILTYSSGEPQGIGDAFGSGGEEADSSLKKSWLGIGSARRGPVRFLRRT